MPRRYGFEREYRTAYSEGYTITENDNETGRVDIHFTPSETYATLCVPENYSEEEIQDLISEIDEQIVMSYDRFRENFIVNVWAGRPAGTYSDDEEEEWEVDEEEEEEDMDGDGHRP